MESRQQRKNEQTKIEENSSKTLHMSTTTDQMTQPKSRGSDALCEKQAYLAHLC